MIFFSTRITKSRTAGRPSSKYAGIWGLLLQNIYLEMQSISRLHIILHIVVLRNGKAGRFPPVPNDFVNLVHVSLYKLVGVMLIPKELVCCDFFQKLRVKFQNAKKVHNFVYLPFFKKTNSYVIFLY